MTSPESHSEPAPTRTVSIARAASSLAASSALVYASGIVSGPILARALGAEGRGLLAGITVPLAFAAYILALSLPEYGSRKVALREATGDVLGTMLVLLAVAAVIGAAVFVPLSAVLADGRDVVHRYLLIGSWLFPLTFLVFALVGVASGLQRWAVAAAAQAAGPLSTMVAIAALALFGALTVKSAAIVTFAGAAIALIPLAKLRRDISRLRFKRELAAEGLNYGGRAAIGGLAVSLNARLDQVLMIPLASARELGLYAVAVTVAGVTTIASGSLGDAIFPRVAAGEHRLVAQAARVALLTTLAIAVPVAALSYPVLRYVFGPDFADATPMVLVSLVAYCIAAVNIVLAYSLRSIGRPGLVSVAEIAGVAITIPGILLLVPPLGGMGAALVTVIAYAAIFIVLFVRARAAFGGSVRDYVAFRRADIATVSAAVMGPVRSVRGRLRRRGPEA